MFPYFEFKMFFFISGGRQPLTYCKPTIIDNNMILSYNIILTQAEEMETSNHHRARLPFALKPYGVHAVSHFLSSPLNIEVV